MVDVWKVVNWVSGHELIIISEIIVTKLHKTGHKIMGQFIKKKAQCHAKGTSQVAKGHFGT